MTPCKYTILILTICAIICSCNRKLDKALSNAGNNRSELVKVLDHFKNDPDPLKYKSAVFIIENMPYHGTRYAQNADTFSAIYRNMAESALELRDSVLKAEMNKSEVNNYSQQVDINTIKADYLIKAINDACDTWHHVNWHNEYNEKIFFDYVLPYRIVDEPLSNWRDFIKKHFPYLNQSIIYSSKGIKYHASEATTKNARITEEPSAANGKCVWINQPNSYVEFSLKSSLAIQKIINLRYCSLNKGAKALVELNGVRLKVFNLEPTKNVHTFRSSRFGLPIKLHKGENKIKISYINSKFGLDYIEEASLEPINKDKLPDFSNFYCQIYNVGSGMFASLDTLKSTMLKPIELHKFSEKDMSINLRLDYLGYSSWKLSPMDTTNMCMEDRWVSFDYMAPVGKYNYLGANHQKWVIIPVKENVFKIMNKETGLFWEQTKDTETGKQIIVQNSYKGTPSQLWRIIKKEINPFYAPFFKMGSAVSEALKITDVMAQFEFIGNRGEFSPSLTDLLKFKTGICQDESSYTISLSRYLGIPTAVDFTPHWGNRTNSHSWSVIILPNGKGTPFYMGCVPGDTAQYFHSYLKPKVYRHRFQLNRRIVTDMQSEQFIPALFKNPDFIDVTDEYYQTTNVKRALPHEYHDRKIAYICVFDKEEWVPVDYGKISMGKVKFKSMGRNILYSVGLYEYGEIIPIGNPFIITDDGKIKEVVPDDSYKISMTLLRKYPFFGKQDFFNIRMNLGKFQGDNSIDFKAPTTFYQHEGITEGCWYEKKIKKSNKTYKYLRYLSGPNSFCNINELEFYDNNNQKLSGKIIGTQGTDKQCKETVFDGDILTGFNGNSPDGHWVGLKLSQPATVSKIRYMPRNDGNSIEIGDIYELLMYSHGKWKRMGLKRARSTQLTFKNIPANGLYILKDKTKGVEERIFTYERGKQIWW